MEIKDKVALVLGAVKGIGVKVQDIDNPRLTVKRFRTSITQV
jgi:hypothetical protein